MRKIQFNYIMEEVLLISTKNEIPKKSLVELYKSMPDIDSSIIKDFLIQDFFFTDNTKQKYDFVKIVLFNILYSGGTEQDKADYLFKMLENSQS